MQRSADGRASGELALPESVTDHGDGGGGAIVSFGEAAPAARRDAQHLEIVARHQRGIDRFDMGAAAQDDGLTTGGKHPRHYPLPRRHFAIERIAEGQYLFVSHQTDQHELLAVADGQGAEDHGIQHLVNGGIGADPQCQRQDGCSGEGGTLAQLPQGVAEILRQGIEDGQAALFAMGLAHLRDRAKLAARLSAGGLGREAAPFTVGGEHVQVGGNFFIEACGGAKEATQAGQQDTQRRHASPSRRRFTMATVRDQFSASAASWRRPAAVME
ncbi:hypothetical protein SBA3_420013 [Candidatus Sulfopaludibacter sp. SbA3]|nr:hypothetical protein SBA3_420013 [Candidatus Sulfopaludibacter sp. SbA3]